LRIGKRQQPQWLWIFERERLAVSLERLFVAAERQKRRMAFAYAVGDIHGRAKLNLLQASFEFNEKE